jgi:hypothetical protein
MENVDKLQNQVELPLTFDRSHCMLSEFVLETNIF